MATYYVDTGGSATNSGTTDQNTANLSGSAATVAGSVVSLDGSPDLSGLATSGPTQAAIYINDATNTNRKIFPITNVDNGAKTVTVAVAPTGVTSSAWAIGGRQTSIQETLNAHVGGGNVTIVNNSPASASANIATFRTDGDSTNGANVLRGKDGVRPVLTVTNTSTVINMSSVIFSRVENLELVQQGASGNVMAASSSGLVSIVNVKVSDGGGAALTTTGSVNGNIIIGCDFSGTGGSGIRAAGGVNNEVVIGNYIHDLTGDGISIESATSLTAISNVIDTCSDNGIELTGTISAGNSDVVTLMHNTIYGCGDSGLLVSDQDWRVVLINNIFHSNGNAGGEYNVEWAAGNAENIGWHGYNIFYDGGAGDNLSGLTVNAQAAGSELTTDPQLTDPANGDFTPGSSSPALEVGFPVSFPHT